MEEVHKYTRKTEFSFRGFSCALLHPSHSPPPPVLPNLRRALANAPTTPKATQRGTLSLPLASAASPRPGRQGRGGGDSPKPSAKHAPDVGDGHKIIKKVRDWHHGHHEDHAKKCLVQAFGGEAHFQEKVAQPEELRPSFITRSRSWELDRFPSLHFPPLLAVLLSRRVLNKGRTGVEREKDARPAAHIGCTLYPMTPNETETEEDGLHDARQTVPALLRSVGCKDFGSAGFEAPFLCRLFFLGGEMRSITATCCTIAIKIQIMQESWSCCHTEQHSWAFPPVGKTQ